MKRTVAVLTVMATLNLVIIYVGTKLWAQQPSSYNNQQAPYTTQTSGPVVRTTTRMVNLHRVLKDYKKCESMILDLKQKAKTEYDYIRGQHDQLAAKELKLRDQTLELSEKENLKREIKLLMRQIRDREEDANTYFGQLRANSITAIYHEIEDTVKRMAESQEGIEIVLIYSDPPSLSLMSPEGIQMSKAAQQACLPMYYHPNTDITKTVTDLLNSRYMATAPTGQQQPNAAGIPTRSR